MLDFKALLFDLDGTLLDTAPDFIGALNRQLADLHREPLPSSQIRSAVTNGSVGIIQTAYNLDIEDPQFEALRHQFLDYYLANIAEQTTLFDGMEALLARCTQQGIPWGIVTNKPWKYTEALLDQLNLAHRPATTICPDHVARPKPDPQALLLACSELKINPAECVYVGDHRRDIEAGRSAGMITIAAEWGYIEETENIFDWHADWIAATPNELTKILFG